MLFIRDYKDLMYFKYDDIVLLSWFSNLIRKLCDVSNDIESQIMSQVALKDFKNYLKTTENLIGDIDSDYKVQVLISKYLDKNPDYLKETAEDWLEYWLVKWKQRVKLVINEKKKENSEEKKIDKEIVNILKRIPLIKELKELTIGSLIKNHEICFTDVIADSIIKNELYKLKTKLIDDDKVVKYVTKYPISVLNNIISRVEKLKNYKGYLVVLRVDRSIFNSSSKRWKGLNYFYNWFY